MNSINFNNNDNKLSIEDFILKMSEIRHCNSIIETIFETHFKFDNKRNLISDLNLNISQEFNINGLILLMWLQQNKTINEENINISYQKYKKIIMCINNLRIKYGFIISRLLSRVQNPFLIDSVETLISPNNVLHKIQFIRTDGESLEGLFEINSLMGLTTSILNALQSSMKVGIYNIDKETLKNYMEQSNKFLRYLNKTIEDQNHKENNQIAIARDK
ncbi:hypothetical protein [Clostridium tyrobutyricum]|uniref:hypothetical protein n=1 Tax=Clostridium tyrobutyricum TaxID=1519 RepID=UPI00057FC7E8|nr:hypothetical protein [Clostridium tyrobutyricum]